MRLSAPIYRLKRQAKRLSRDGNIALVTALDQIAAAEGFSTWSMLAAQAARITPAQKIFARLSPGDLMLLGARPGHGKTLLGLELAVAAMKRGHRSMFFTLEYIERDVHDRFRDLGVDLHRFARLFGFDASDDISSDYITARLSSAARGTLAVIDYLQLLDQRRDKPALTTQIRTLHAFARERGLIFVFISQIDRTYDPAVKSCPDLSDVRMPNALDVTLFAKACFLHDGEIRFQSVN